MPNRRPGFKEQGALDAIALTTLELRRFDDVPQSAVLPDFATGVQEFHEVAGDVSRAFWALKYFAEAVTELLLEHEEDPDAFLRGIAQRVQNAGSEKDSGFTVDLRHVGTPWVPVHQEPPPGGWHLWCPEGQHSTPPDEDGNCPEHGTPVEEWH